MSFDEPLEKLSNYTFSTKYHFRRPLIPFAVFFFHLTRFYNIIPAMVLYLSGAVEE